MVQKLPRWPLTTASSYIFQKTASPKLPSGPLPFNQGHGPVEDKVPF